MSGWTKAATIAALVAAAGVGAAMAPAVRGQNQSSRETSKPARVFEVFGGGSWIGVSVAEVDEERAKDAKVANAGGVLIEEVSEDSPAEKAGLKKDDVITEFDGERVRGTRQFARLVQETPAGRKVPVSVMRGGQRLSVTVEPRTGGSAFRYFGNLDRLDDLGRAWSIPKPPPAPAAPAPPAPPGVFDDLLGRSNPRFGITLSDLSPQLATYFGAKEGVLVASVYDNSVAAKAGLRAGDVITSFNGVDVRSPSELRRRMGRLDDGEEFSIGIVRDRKPMTLKGKLEARTERRRTII